jgi:hypothetical protein
MTVKDTFHLWAQRSFADQLLATLNNTNTEYQNFLNGDVEFAGPVVSGDVVADQRVRLATLTSFVERTTKLLTPEIITLAFGADGYSGDEKAVRLFASSLSGTYLDILQWARATRACTCNEAQQPMYPALANYARQPLSSFWDFATDFSSRVNTIEADIEAGRTPTTTLTVSLHVTVNPEDTAPYMALLHAHDPAPAKHGFFKR